MLEAKQIQRELLRYPTHNCWIHELPDDPARDQTGLQASITLEIDDTEFQVFCIKTFIAEVKAFVAKLIQSKPHPTTNWYSLRTGGRGRGRRGESEKSKEGKGRDRRG